MLAEFKTFRKIAKNYCNFSGDQNFYQKHHRSWANKHPNANLFQESKIIFDAEKRPIH
jgi:hypothetical protein